MDIFTRLNQKFLILLFVLLFAPTSLILAQISLTATGGTTTGSYTTLGAAFAAINSGTHTGTISISVTGNTSETSTAVLNANGSGSASYASISISPSGGSNRIISGSISGAPLVDLNGADNITINGLNTGGNALYFENQNTSTGNTSTIRFVNDACNNLIQNCFLLGASTSATAGTVFFSTGTTIGNDNDTIRNCVLDVSGSNFPTNALYCNGSTTSGIENNNNFITNNNIANFFNAASVSYGIYLAAGAMNWNISGNKIYQSAARTYTTAMTNAAISIVTGTGHTLNGNTIGFSNSGGTGMYTITASSVALQFIGINLALATSGTNNITNNTIANITLNTTAVAATLNGNLCGINLSSGNANIIGNTIGATTGTGSLISSSSGSLGAVVGIHSASVNTISILNNTFGAFSSVGPAVTIGGSVLGVSVSGVATSITIKNNTIGNATANNMLAGATTSATAATVAIGINATAACVVANFSNNTIRNFTSNGTGGGNARGIFTGTTTNVTYSYTIDSNTVSDITSNSSLASVTSGLTAAAGIHYFPGLNGSVSYNTIYNIACINSTVTTNTIATGIALANASNPMVRRNKIYDIKNAGVGTAVATPAMAAGITIRSGNGSCNIINNMISLGNGQTGNTTFIGIFCNHGSSPNPADNIYYNTVNIEGTVSSGAQPSFALHRGNFAASAVNPCVMDIRNNILNNTRTGGTGRHFAIGNYYGATTINTTGWGTKASNYNVLNAIDSNIGYWTTSRSFASWKAITNCDTNSVSGIPITFVNSANNLHLNMGVNGTYIESGGTTIATVNIDFDNQTRPGPSGSVNGGGLAPDIGCDEYDGVPLDAYAPVIAYNQLSNTSSTSNRTLNSFATITDYFNGVNTNTGSRPRIYFKKRNDNNTFGANTSATNGWKWVEASNATSPFSFTIDHGILNGGSVNIGDTIQYFVVAQDLSAPINVGANPLAGFVATSVSSITSAPTIPNFYMVTNALSSTTLNVGSGQTYTSLTNAGGLFAAINNGVLAGNTIVNITSDLSEDGTNALNAYGMGGYTLTIQPSAASTRIISNSADLSQAMIRLNGAPGVTINGSSGGGGKYLRIVNTHSVAANGMPALSISANCDNTAILNCILESNTQGVTQATLALGNGNNSLTLKGNTFRDAQGTPGTAGVPYSAVYSNDANNKIMVGGNSASEGNDFVNFTRFGLNLQTVADSVKVLNNNFYQSGVRMITFFSVGIQSGSSHTVSNNNFYQTAGVDSGGFVGVFITGGGTGHTIHNNSIGGSNANRTGNPFQFYSPSSTAPYYVSGIYLTVGSTPATSVQGNYFSNIGNMAVGAGAHVFAINASAGNINIGTTTGNIIGGLAAASDTIVNGYDNGMINYSGAGVVAIENNTIGNIAYYSAGGDRNSGITILGTCQASIKNNIIRDITSNSSDAGFPTVYSPMGICVAGGLFNGSNIEGNTIYNITNTNTGASGYQSVGLYIVACDATTTVKRNRIYNIKANSTGTGTAGAKIAGIYMGPSASATVSNNQITLGTGATGESIVYGIYDNSTGTNNYYYNSIYMDGNTSAGTNNSYCFYRNSTCTINVFNNIFYNARTTSGTGRMYAAGILSATNLTTSNSNNNLLVSTASNSLVQYTGTGMDLLTWKTISAKDGFSLGDTTANVIATNLFNNTTNGNLNILPGNKECWWSNGLGKQISTISEDFASTSANRSTSVVNGGTDIGSDEFTPSITPPALVIGGSHTNNGTETFTLAGRPIASLIWGNNGTLPSITSANFYSGTWPNDPTNNGTSTNATYFNSYLNISANGGSAYTYDMILNYDDALLGTVSSKGNALLAKKQNSVAGTWNLYGGANNTTANTLTVYNLKSFSEFTGSEVATPLGPVALSYNLINGNQTLCSGMTPATLTGTTPIGGTGSYTYSWLSSTTSAVTGFSAISGATAINYTPGALTVTTWFKRVVTSGANDTSSAITITINPPITSNTISSAQTICSGGVPASLTGSSPAGGGSSTYTYQWLLSTTASNSGFNIIVGANSQNYAPPSLTTTSWYRRMVKTNSCVDTSSALQITVIPPITSNTISSAQSICSGSVPSTLTGSTPAGGGSASYTYQWMISNTSAIAGFTAISGATSINYSPGAISANTWFKRVVSTSSCSDTSTAIAISLIAGITNNNIFSAQTICFGSTPFAITGSAPVGGGGSYVYQWLSSTTSATIGYTAISGATSGGAYAPGALTTTTWYRRLVNSATSSCPDTSAAIEITVNPPITNNTISSAQTLCAGSTPTTLTGSNPSGGGGGGYNFQWLASLTSASAGFNVIGGATGPNYSPGALSQNVWYRRLVTTLTCVDSSAAIMISITPKINTNNISAPQDICSGTAPSSLTGSTPLGGNGTFSFQWVSSTTNSTTGFSDITGATASNYAPSILTQTSWYRRIVYSGSCSDTSAPIRILVNPVIGNNTISSSQSVCEGVAPAALTGSTPTGGSAGYTYRWLISTTNATTGYSPVPGGITNGLTLGVLTSTSWYRRIVYSSTCFDTSAFVKITVNPLPLATITGATNVCSGSTQTYSVPSQAGISFVWTVTGGTITNGAGSNSITVSWGAAGAGSVGVTLNNSTTLCNAASSKSITIGNTPDPTATGPATVCSGTTQNYTTTNTGNTFLWSVNGGTIITGVNTNTISVTWGNGPTGTVKVTETAGLCSDTSVINVIVNLTPNLPIITRNLGILSVTPVAGATYQWFKDGNLLPGATNSSINASINNGVYTVTVTNAGCSTTSNPFTYISSGINQFSNIRNISFFPNPTSGKISVSMRLNNKSAIRITITDAAGRTILHTDEGISTGDFLKQYDMSAFAKGVYFIVIQSDEEKVVGRIVRE